VWRMKAVDLRYGLLIRAKRNKRVVSQFEDLQQCYLKLRHRARDEDAEQQPDADAVPASEPSAADDERMPKRQRGDSHDAQPAAAANSPAAWSAGEGLNEFVRMLSVFTHCSRLRVGTLTLLQAQQLQTQHIAPPYFPGACITYHAAQS